jgi:dolichol-phosphate mannosyltransferase
LIKIILCAFNEAKNLEKLISAIIHEFELMAKNFEIIFCLDCTTDNSVKIIEGFRDKCQITILPIDNQRGLGIAYKKAFLHVIQNCDKNDIIISFDADCTHNPSQIPAMLEIFTKDNLDLMIASRFVDKSSIKHFPFYRKMISLSISILLRNLFPIKNSKNQIKDYTSGYRIYKNSVLQFLFEKKDQQFITEKDFTCLIEILIRLNQVQAIKNFCEYPIKYDYSGKIGASKLRLFHNFYRLIFLCFKLLK